MKVLNNMEVNSVNGGVCENMSIAECMDGLSEKAAEEMKIAYEIWLDSPAYAQLSSWGGDFGIWLYNVTHDC